VGIETYLATEKHECFQDKSYIAKFFAPGDFFSKSYIAHLMKTSMSWELSLIKIWRKEPFSSITLYNDALHLELESKHGH